MLTEARTHGRFCCSAVEDDLITLHLVSTLGLRLAPRGSNPHVCLQHWHLILATFLSSESGYGSRARWSADRLSPQIRTAMAPSTQQLAVAAVAAAGCTAFVAAPSTARGPTLRRTTQGRAAPSSSSSSSSSGTLRHLKLSFEALLLLMVTVIRHIMFY